MRRLSPVLVTGLPRSGTTWVARMLAQDASTAMLGREPMNPRAGQFGLAGGASRWVSWDHVPPSDARVLRRTYRGLEPRTYGRLGIRQWRAPLPSSRIIVKDPFALLSLAAVASVTGARPVVVFRTPAATLASYRRMGWSADLEEAASLGADFPSAAVDDDAVAMAFFWRWAYKRALTQIERVPDAVVVSHAELTSGGPAALQALLREVGLTADVGAVAPTERTQPPADTERLHNFERTATEVMSEWRERVTPAEIDKLEDLTGDVLASINARKLALPAG